MRSIFEPLGWAVRKLDKDNGIDFEVEIFDNFKSTGVFFKVQLKSSGRTQYSASKDFISQPIKSQNARYLCHEVRLPVVLIHADITKGGTFWVAPQLLADELQHQIEGANRKEISIRIPTTNELSNTINKLVETITAVEQVLASRLIISTPAADFVASINQHVDEDRLIQELQDKGDALKLDQAHQLYQSGRYPEAIDKAQRVLNNNESSVLNKFLSLIQIERAEMVVAMRSQAPQLNYSLIKLRIARDFRRVTKKGPRNLKLYALIAWKAAQLESLAQKYHGLLLNWVAHSKGNNVIWQAQLVFEKTRVYRQILSKYNQCIRLANYSLRLEDARALPDALMRIIEAISRFILNLTSENLNELADKYSASALQICKIAAWIAVQLGNDENLFTVATKALTTKRSPTGPAVDFALATMNNIRDDQTRRKTQELFDLTMRLYRGEKIEGPVKTTHRQIYENMASSLEIDLSNKKDLMARLVQVGIQDLDPSRVLADCEHIFITLAVRNTLEQYVSEIFQLPTAGSKVIHCTLHRRAIVGLTLDGTYEHFKNKYCSKCGDCKPRPESWHYSEEWQQSENKKHLDYMREFYTQTEAIWEDVEE